MGKIVLWFLGITVAVAVITHSAWEDVAAGAFILLIAGVVAFHVLGIFLCLCIGINPFERLGRRNP